MTLELKSIGLEVDGKTHIYPTDLQLIEGGFNTLLGTTLAGKTTLMQIMAGLLKPSTGEIWFDGKNVTNVPVQKRNVSMVYQQFINYPNMSVYENIASPLRVARLTSSEIKKRVEAIADLLKLSPMLQRRPSELSGGQQQRTAMARALVKDAVLVLLDEPLANLDFKLREELRDELPRLFADRRCTLVYATTEPSEALLLGGHTVALNEGRVAQFGPSGEIYRNPSHLLTAKVFSEPPLNTVPVKKEGARFRIDNDAIWDAIGTQSGVADGDYLAGIRPHHVLPAKHSTTSVDRGVVIEGRVLITEISGSESVVHFDYGGFTWISQAHGIHAYELGEVASFCFDPRHAFLFDVNGTRVAAPPQRSAH
ncbi:MAG: ABC transporter ATP-binding protein [Pseudomonadota bacterium]